MVPNDVRTARGLRVSSEPTEVHRSLWSRAVAILNPVAGRGRGARAEGRLSGWFGVHFRGTSLEPPALWVTTQETSAHSLAERAVRDGYDLVVVCGGDGTLNGVVNGLAGSRVALGLVPLGTGNDFARAIGVPLDPEKAIRQIAAGDSRKVDLGVRDGRRFINVAGCGFDAEVARCVNAGLGRLNGAAAYVTAVVRTLWTFRPGRFRVSVDGSVFDGPAMLCAVANGIGYGGGMRVAPRARYDDGLLDVCIVGACGRAEFLSAFPRVFRGAHLNHPKVSYLRGCTVRIECDPPQPVLIDGELDTMTPARFEVLPNALEFVGGGAAKSESGGAL